MPSARAGPSRWGPPPGAKEEADAQHRRGHQSTFKRGTNFVVAEGRQRACDRRAGHSSSISPHRMCLCSRQVLCRRRRRVARPFHGPYRRAALHVVSVHGVESQSSQAFPDRGGFVSSTSPSRTRRRSPNPPRKGYERRPGPPMVAHQGSLSPRNVQPASVHGLCEGSHSSDVDPSVDRPTIATSDAGFLGASPTGRARGQREVSRFRNPVFTNLLAP